MPPAAANALLPSRLFQHLTGWYHSPIAVRLDAARDRFPNHLQLLFQHMPFLSKLTGFLPKSRCPQCAAPFAMPRRTGATQGAPATMTCPSCNLPLARSLRGRALIRYAFLLAGLAIYLVGSSGGYTEAQRGMAVNAALLLIAIGALIPIVYRPRDSK